MYDPISPGAADDISQTPRTPSSNQLEVRSFDSIDIVLLSYIIVHLNT